MRGSIHIGTSGYSYKHWRNDFYPARLAAKNYLTYYADHFKAVEINASFYRIPQEHTLEAWAAQVPDDFVFCPKMSRYLTHMKKLRDPEEPLSRFFNVFAALWPKMGPVLFQLPDMLHFNAGVVRPFYDAFRSAYPDYRAAFEIRHPSWLADESLQLMQDYRISLVVNQSGEPWPYAEIITSRDVYLRFHGPRQLYASSYSDEDLADYAAKMRAWASEGLDVWAFFNNDIHGFAPRDAARLQAMLAQV